VAAWWLVVADARALAAIAKERNRLREEVVDATFLVEQAKYLGSPPYVLRHRRALLAAARRGLRELADLSPETPVPEGDD